MEKGEPEVVDESAPQTDEQGANASSFDDHHHEFEFSLIVVFLGFLGIAVLMYFIMFEGKGIKIPGISSNNNQQVMEEEIEIPEIYTGEDDPTYVQGRDVEVLGLGIIQENNKFFYHPETKKTLYALQPGKLCTGDCAEKFEPYIAPKSSGRDALTTFYIKELGEHQYAWNGQLLYTYSGDKGYANFTGDGFAEMTMRIARP